MDLLWRREKEGMDCDSHCCDVYTDGWGRICRPDHAADAGQPDGLSSFAEIGAKFCRRSGPARLWIQAASALSCLAGSLGLDGKNARMDDTCRSRFKLWSGHCLG